jgi:DNA primase
MIPESFIQEVLNRIDVVDIVDQRVKLKKAGANYVACCPFHQEKSPSFTVSPSKQFYHCFGCGAHGSAISFLMEYEGLTFIESIQSIASQLGLSVPNEQTTSKSEKSDYLILEQALIQANQFYKKNLRASKEAIQYLKNRGLSGEIAKQFQIGFANQEWQGLQQVFKNYDDPILQSAGLVQKNEAGKLYDRFRNRIMFPIFNAKDNIIGFGGRVIHADDTPKYYNSPETPLFKKSYELYGLSQSKKGIRDEQNILIVEGYMDVISLHQHGVQNAVATLGTATTVYHLKKLIRYSKKITFCFDGDNAGIEAAWKALNTAVEILEDDLEFYFMFLPEGEDPDTYIRNHSLDDFKKMINQATPLSDFIIKRLTSNNDLNSQENKIKFINNFEPIYKKMSSPKYKIFLLKRVSELIHLSQVEIEKMVGGKSLSVNQSMNTKIKYSAPAKNTLTAKRKYILIVLIHPKLFNPEDQKVFQGNSVDDEIYKAMLSIIEGNDAAFENSASLFHGLADRVEEKLINELQNQIMNYAENIDLEAEFTLVQSVLNNLSTKQIQSQKLAALKNKKLSELTAEEKDFLKNFKK